MKQDNVLLSWLVIIHIAWFLVRSLMYFVFGIDDQEIPYTIAITSLTLLVFVNSGLQNIINVANRTIFLLWGVYMFFLYYHTAIERPSLTASMYLPGIKMMVFDTLKYLLISYVFFSQLVDIDKLLNRLMIVLTMLNLFTFLYILYTVGTKFILVEALVFGPGVSLITLSYSVVLSCILSIYVLSRKDLNEDKSWAYLCTAISLLLILIMGKRGALLSVIIPVLSLYLFANKTFKQSMTYILVVFVGYLIVVNNMNYVFAFLALFSSRLAEESAAAYYLGDTNGRDILWETALLQFEKNPLFGYYPRLIELSKSSWAYGLHPHNYWLEALMTMGLLGAVPLFFYMLHLIVKRMYYAIQSSTMYRFWALLFLSEMVHGTFSGALNVSSIWLAMFVLCGYSTDVYEDEPYEANIIPEENI